MARDIVEWLLGNIKVNENGCFEWQGWVDECGYGRLRIDGRTFKAHRVSFAVFRGREPGDLCVCHHCDNRKCINPSHLFTGTKKDNSQDAVNKDRIRRGQNSPKSKLTEGAVSAVVERFNAGESMKSLAQSYGVDCSTLWRAVRGETWCRVDKQNVIAANPRSPRGEKHSRAKLTEDGVRSIRSMAASGVTHKSLAEQFGVTQFTIKAVVYKRNWAHIT